MFVEKIDTREIFTREIFHKNLKLFALKFWHFTFTIIMFALAWLIFTEQVGRNFRVNGGRYNYFVVIIYSIVFSFFCRVYNTYLLGYNRVRTLVFLQFISQLFSTIIIYLAVSIAWYHFYNPFVFFVILPFYLILNSIWSYLGNKFYLKINPQKNTILIYRNLLDKKRFGSIYSKSSEKLYRITHELMYDGTFSELKEQLEGYDAIFVAGVNSRCRNGILKYCQENNVIGFFLPHIGDVIMHNAKHIYSFKSPVLYVERKVLTPEYALIKRSVDIIFSALGLVILSPILVMIAIFIKFYDGGSVFYKQVRLTKDAREFTILKFRTMRENAEEDGIARLSSGDKDTRITPIGRWLRKCRFDEMPQLWNILTGDMSIVGPRPERPEISEQYYKIMPDFKLRLQVKAGLTGYAQVYGKYNTDPYEKLEFDLMYINNMCFFTDLKLMFATFSILFLPESTQGIDPGQVTALDYEFERR